MKFRAADVVGRQYMCCDPLLGKLDYEGFYQACRRRRKDETCIYYANGKGFDNKQKRIAEGVYGRLKGGYGAARGRMRRCARNARRWKHAPTSLRYV